MILMVIDWAWNKWIFEKSLMAWRQLIWRAMLLMAHCSDELFVTRYNVKCYCYCYCFVVIAIIVLFCSVLFCFAIVRAFCYFIASPHHCTPVRVGILQNKHCSRNFWGSFDCAEQYIYIYIYICIHTKEHVTTLNDKTVVTPSGNFGAIHIRLTHLKQLKSWPMFSKWALLWLVL